MQVRAKVAAAEIGREERVKQVAATVDRDALDNDNDDDAARLFQTLVLFGRTSGRPSSTSPSSTTGAPPRP